VERVYAVTKKYSKQEKFLSLLFKEWIWRFCIAFCHVSIIWLHCK
jgi:hypothetical protein